MAIGWETLDVGEQALVYAFGGRARIVDGPRRLFLWRAKYVRLIKYIASQSEYLVIKNKNGHIEHKPGPCIVFLNPLEHDSIRVKEGTSLDANQVLVVYRQDAETKEVDRYLQNGPTLFMPHANEWLHNFCWHGTDPNNKTRKVAGILKFTKLQVIPDQFYYNVDEVRTADDALIRVKLMFFYEIKHVEQMLNTTKDPIADFINCICADVIAFASKLSYMEFIDRSSELNDLKFYPQLVEGSQKIGYNFTKVVFRGYYAAPKLQQMHDTAIESRTRLKIAYETEEQTQELTDMNINMEMERLTMEQSMELNDVEHRHNIQSCEEEHKLLLMKEQHTEKIHRREEDEQAKLNTKKLSNDQHVSYLSELKSKGVDMMEYILAQRPRPAKLVHIVADEKTANLHLHQ